MCTAELKFTFELCSYRCYNLIKLGLIC